jgi:phospholipid/cholesterol/gamma-HCH transport system substrate-binding protein
MGLFSRNGRTSFLERNQLVIGAIGSLLVVGGSVAALGLSAGIFSSTYSVEARFTDTAGLKSGDDVQIAGLEAGQVGSVAIDGGEVAVQLKINSGIEIPADSGAEIAIETLLGKKNVTISHGESNTMLAEGDVIASEQTRTPVSLVELADTSVPLLEESDADALEQFMVEVTKITKGKKVQVTSLIENFGDVAEAIDLRRDELKRLIDSLRTVAATFAERDDTLVSLIDNFDVVLGELAQRTDQIRGLLVNTDSASHEIADLVRRNRANLDGSFIALAKTLNVVDKHQVELAASIAYLEDAVRGYQSVGYSQGTKNRWANIFVQSLGPLGADAFLGPCGTFDQALDDLLGPDPRPCDERQEAEQGDDNEDPGAPLPEGEDAPTDTVQDLIEEVTGDIGDLLDSVTGSTGLGAALRGGLL